MKESLPEFLYHYTIGSKIPLILNSGHLLPTRVGVNESSGEIPVLWFSSNQTWEPTATKMLMIGGRLVTPSVRELAAYVPLFRFRLRGSFGGETGMLPWPALCKVARIQRRTANAMVSAGREMGANPAQWWGTLKPIPLLGSELEIEECIGFSAKGPKWGSVSCNPTVDAARDSQVPKSREVSEHKKTA